MYGYHCLSHGGAEKQVGGTELWAEVLTPAIRVSVRDP